MIREHNPNRRALAAVVVALAVTACDVRPRRPGAIETVRITRVVDGPHGRERFTWHLDVATGCALRRVYDDNWETFYHDRDCRYSDEIKPRVAAIVAAVEDDPSRLDRGETSPWLLLSACYERDRCAPITDPALRERVSSILHDLDRWPHLRPPPLTAKGWRSLVVRAPWPRGHRRISSDGTWECRALAGPDVCRDDPEGHGDPCSNDGARHYRRWSGRLDEATAVALIHSLDVGVDAVAPAREDVVSARLVGEGDDVRWVDAQVAVRRWNATVGARVPECALRVP